MDKQAKEAKEMAKNLPIKEKISYIWMYYKWWIVGITAAILIIGGTVFEVLTRPTYDLEIAYYSNDVVSEETIAVMEEYFAQFVDDTDGNGEKNVKIYNTYLSLGGEDPTAQVMVQNKFVAELSSKSYSVFILDDTFAQIIQNDSFEGTLNELRDMAEYPELKDKFKIKDGTHVYWGTRTVYPSEADQEKRIVEYNRALQTETAIFGERK